LNLIYSFFSEAFPLLVVVAGAIGGLLLTVVVIVVLLACRRAVSSKPDLSDWPRIQQDRLSTSTNTTSNQEDLDGSDSIPEIYLKSQPDILNSNLVYGGSGNYAAGKVYSNNYSNYRSYSSENNLLDNNKFVPNYSSPYLQSVSPVSDVLHTHSPVHHAHLPGHAHSGWDPVYNSGRFNAVAHSLHSTEVDLNESSVGTHV